MGRRREKRRRSLPAAVCAALLLLAGTLLAIHVSHGGVYHIDITEISPLTAEEIDRYSLYTVHPQDWTAEDILSRCTLIETEEIGGAAVCSYASQELPACLYDCREVTEILRSRGNLTLTYQTMDDRTVSLTFSEDGLIGHMVYDPLNDTLCTLTDDYTKTVNFRRGSYDTNSMWEWFLRCVLGYGGR